jgi:DNA invertase Pin-like site-specific DNA recombinase
MASVAQWEAQIIGERTRVALAERQAAGVTLGAPAECGCRDGASN